MQTLPANGQAQPLPGKWVIKRHPGNAEMVNKWANEKFASDSYWSHNDYLSSDGRILDYIPRLYTELSDSQFKAMVEGEGKQRPLSEIYKDMADNKDRAVMIAYENLIVAGEHDLAASLKSKHPDIWPVDWEKEIVRTSLAFYRKCYHGEKPDGLIEEVQEWMQVHRNYLTNQNKEG